MKRFVPSDQSARDRFAADIGNNLCVSASAGAGKTTAIVSRVQKLVETDPEAESGRHPAERLAVVTYGERAAEELRVRCRTRILNAELSPPHKNRQLNLLRQATFGTIHSFCLKLLRDFGGARGIPPEIRLLPESDQVFFEAFKQDVDLGGLDWPEDLAREVLRYRTFEELFELARRIRPDQIEDLIVRRQKFMEPPDVEPLLLYSVKSKRSAGTVGGHQATLHRWRDGMAAGSPFLHLPDIQTGEKEFKEMAAGIVDPYRQWLAEGMVKLSAYLARAYRDYRMSEGRLTYDDMVGETWRLIQDPSVLEAIRAHGWILILDEAQDTDATMFRILTEITRPVGAALGTWPGQDGAPGPEAGRFSFVGDDQQCIYSDRADIGQYLQYVHAYAEGRGGDRIEFQVTMRCPARVVETVNATFPGRLHQSRASFRRMESLDRERPWPERVFRVPLALEPESNGVDDRFGAECEAMGVWLRECGLEGLGVAAWSDVAILCPRVKWLAEAGDALSRHGIPVAHQSSGSQAGEQPSSSWPVALFHVLCHPFDRFELIGVLRDIFAFPDARIEAVHRGSPSGLDLFSRPEGDPEMAKVFDWLQRAYDLLADREAGPGERAVPLGRLVRRLCGEIQLAERIEAAGDAPETLSRFIHSATEASAKGIGLRDWLVDRRLQLTEKSPPLTSLGGVDLISCHKAKGLEWKVVILLGLWRKISDRNPSYPVIRQRAGAIQILADGRSETEKERERSQLWRIEDYQRLIYVAMTRSQGSLIFSDPDIDFDPSSFGGFIGWSEIRDQIGEPEVGGSATVAPAGEKDKAAPQARPVDGQAFKDWATRIPERLTPHELAHDEEMTSPLIEVVEWDEPGIGGVDYGTCWHEWIEKLPWQSRPEACRNAVEGAGPQAPDELVERFQREAHAFLESPCIQDILAKGKRFFPELTFTWAMEGNRWMEGVIDLLVETDAGWWILDWKTNRRLEAESDQSLHDRLISIYRGQIQAYADFIQSRKEGVVVRASLYSTVTAQEVLIIGSS